MTVTPLSGSPEPHVAVMALMSAADRTRRELVRALQPFDLTLQQFNVLIILERANGRQLPTLDVARRLVEQAPAITHLMNTLTAKKYIRRQPCKNDRRQQLCSLTAAGKRLIDSVIPAIKAAHRQIVGELTTAEVAKLTEILHRVAIPRA